MRVDQNMAVHYNINLQASSVIMMASMFLISLPVTYSMVELSRSIDEQILASATSPHTFDTFQIGSDGKVSVKLELDMMFTLDQLRDLNRPANKSSGKSMFYNRKWLIWPSNTLYYQFGEGTAHLKNNVIKAMNMYMNYTCLKFIESNTSTSRVKFTASGGGCWAHVGNLHRVQLVNLGGGCNYVPVALHEIGHAIGLYHEHQRPDRDSYIRFDYEYQKHSDNSKKIGGNDFALLGTRYDYRSVMHYGTWAGIRTLDPAYQYLIGRAYRLSFNDIKAINLWYSCASTSGCQQYEPCEFSGFVMPRFSFTLEGNIHKLLCFCWCDSGDSYNPLTPCFIRTQEVPGYNIPKSSSSSELKQTVCTDMRTDCATLKENDGCSINLRTMYTQCTKTCNFCGKGENLCMDYEDGCRMMAGSGACKDEALKEIMSKMCRKSCGLCQTPATPCDIEDTLF